MRYDYHLQDHFERYFDQRKKAVLADAALLHHQYSMPTSSAIEVAQQGQFLRDESTNIIEDEDGFPLIYLDVEDPITNLDYTKLNDPEFKNTYQQLLADEGLEE